MNKAIRILLLVLIVVISCSTFSLAEDDYSTVVDQKTGDVIFETAMTPSVGDYYINEQNKKYKIVEVNGKQAKAKFQGTVELVDNEKEQFALSEGLIAKDSKKKVALYHTHSAESYKPTSGTESEPGQGDIHTVSKSLEKSLEKKGIKVIYNDANHEPHDGGAYERSRRTATKLARKRPDAIFDIHRDGVPNAKEYVTETAGKRAAKVRLVVGRQNPQGKVNNQFAKQLKAVTDKYYPGLIKGIYYAKGKYNQDLSPRSLILEMGTHVIPAKLAIASTDLIADSINKLLYGGPQGGMSKQAKQQENRSSFSSILIILTVALIGGGLLLVANEGSLTGAVNRIKNLKDDDNE